MTPEDNHSRHGSAPGTVTLHTSAAVYTWILLLLFSGIFAAGLLAVRHDPLPKQMVLWCVSLAAVVVLYVSILRSRYSFQKITLTPDRIVLLGAGRKNGGEILPLHDIQTWSHKRLQLARGYLYLVTFKMKDGRTYELKCAAKYGLQVIDAIKERLDHGRPGAGIAV